MVYNIAVKPDTEKLNSNLEKNKTHPCFNKCAHDYARIHIPIAPKCNISCNYCSRKYDCVNESRPGVTSTVVSPEQALERFKFYQEKLKNITVVGIAGPGDALANFDEVRDSIKLIHKESPSTTFCLSTNGLMLPFYANEIVELGVSHVTITINTVDPEIGAKLYKSINYLGNKYEGIEGARILLQNQLSGLRFLTSKGIVCKVNIVYVKGINDIGIEDTVRKVKECGAFITNIMPMISVPESEFRDLETVSTKELMAMRKKCEIELQQMYHCKQCRADAVGKLSHDISQELYKAEEEVAASKPKPLRFAIASKTGLNIDQHFGHASQFRIYDLENGEVKFIENRSVDRYCEGIEDCNAAEDKITNIIKTIGDCDKVLALRIGTEPMARLQEKNITVHQLFAKIETGIVDVAEGRIS